MDQELSRYRDLLRASVDWFWETDQDLRVIKVSSGFRAAVGRPEHSVEGRPLIDLAAVDGPEGRELAEALGHLLASRRAFRHLPIILIDAAGKRLRVLVNGLPYYEPESGRYAGYRGTAVRAPSSVALGSEESETNRRLLNLLETALSRKDELEIGQLEAAAKSDWSKLGALAHELRTPLNAILGFAEIIRDQRFGENLDRYRQYAGLIHDSGHHLLDVVQDLLELTDRERRKVEHAAGQLIDPLKVASFVLIVMEEEAARLGISLVNRLPESLPGVRAERRMLRQILLNLVTNAIKYTVSGGEVRISASIEDGAMLAITVSDTGIGIRREDQERIFERHVRAASAAHLEGGKGLGLAIARDLARKMGGDIRVTSEPAKGSHFTLALPLPDSGQPETEKQKTQQRVSGRRASKTKPEAVRKTRRSDGRQSKSVERSSPTAGGKSSS
jgi:signal transduction histidine kinase